MSQATLEADKVGSISATLTQLVTPRTGGRINSMHHVINMEYHNIGVLQQILTGLYNAVGNLEQKMHYLSQNGTAQSIKDSSTIVPKDNFKVWLSMLTSYLDRVKQLT